MSPGTRRFPRGSGQRAGCRGPARQTRPESGSTVGGPGGSADPGPHPTMGQCPLGVHLPAQRKSEAPVPVGRAWELSKPLAAVSREPDYPLQGPRGTECGPSSAAQQNQLLSQSNQRQEALTQALMWVFLSHTLPGTSTHSLHQSHFTQNRLGVVRRQRDDLI